MKTLEYKNIEEMILSEDKDCKYLAVSMLRKSKDLLSFGESLNLIQKVPVIERIKNFGDICDELNITEESTLLFLNPKNKQEKSLNALNKLFKISEVYNEDKMNFPNLDNPKLYHYFPYFKKENGLWFLHGSCYWSVLVSYLATEI